VWVFAGTAGAAVDRDVEAESGGWRGAVSMKVEDTVDDDVAVVVGSVAVAVVGSAVEGVVVVERGIGFGSGNKVAAAAGPPGTDIPGTALVPPLLQPDTVFGTPGTVPAAAAAAGKTAAGGHYRPDTAPAGSEKHHQKPAGWWGEQVSEKVAGSSGQRDTDIHSPGPARNTATIKCDIQHPIE